MGSGWGEGSADPSLVPSLQGSSPALGGSKPPGGAACTAPATPGPEVHLPDRCPPRPQGSQNHPCPEGSGLCLWGDV